MALSTEKSEFGLLELLTELREVRDRLLALEREMRGKLDSGGAALDEAAARLERLHEESAARMKRLGEEMGRYEEGARRVLREVERIREDAGRLAASVEVEAQKQLEAVLARAEGPVEEFVRKSHRAVEEASAALQEALSGIREAGEREIERLRAGFGEVAGDLRGEAERLLGELLRRHESSVRALEQDLRGEMERARDGLRKDVMRQAERLASGAAELQQVRGELEGLRAASVQRIRAMEEKIAALIDRADRDRRMVFLAVSLAALLALLTVFWK